jgi:hypothetical protein
MIEKSEEGKRRRALKYNNRGGEYIRNEYFQEAATRHQYTNEMLVIRLEPTESRDGR